MTTELLVAAGEASGDRAAASVVRVLRAEAPHVRVLGLGGAALEAEGVSLLADLRHLTAMGVGPVVAKGRRIARAHAALVCAASRPSVAAALLVNYTEFNLRLAPRLRALGVRVLWYGAPQVWAWRRSRISAVRRSIDRMAVVLPFEEALWREQGVDCYYVGHPASEVVTLSRQDAREQLGLTELSVAVALLPGSRPHEVRQLLPRMLAAYENVRRDRASVNGRVLLAPSLDGAARRFVVELSHRARVKVVDVDPTLGAACFLSAFDVTLCASGTAALEAALARAIPVVVYRVGLVTELFARALLRSAYVALPNVLLGRPAFTELLQRDATSLAMAGALRHAIDHRDELCVLCEEVRALLGTGHSPSREVARMLVPWLRESSLVAS
jgi:lipid-A-disaccharide synthase